MLVAVEPVLDRELMVAEAQAGVALVVPLFRQVLDHLELMQLVLVVEEDLHHIQLQLEDLVVLE